jgi:DNA-binding protein YbaB
MGNFYSNITIKSTQLDAIVQQINSLDHTTFVAAAEKGFTCVFPWDDLAVFDIASDLSKHLSCVTFAAMNHDDDVLMCKLYDSGTLLDEYNSTPEFFGEGNGPKGGNAERLIQAFGAKSNAATVNTILKKKYLFAIGRHSDLVQELGLPAVTVGSGYEYITRGDCHVDVQDTVKTGSGKDEKEGGTMGRMAAARRAKTEALNNLVNNPSSIGDLVLKAQAQAKDQLKSMKESLVTGNAGGDAVVITSRGLLLESVSIKEDLLDSDDPHELEDLLVTAMNDCANKIRMQIESMKARMLEDVQKLLG